MIYRKQFLRAIMPLLAALALITPAFSTQTTKALGSGVSLYQDIDTNPNSALIINAVTIDLANPAVKVKSAVGKDVVYLPDAMEGREKISSMAARKNAVACVNADFFPFTGDPLGICIIDGELVSEPGNSRVAFALPASGPAFFDNPKFYAFLTANGATRQIDGINRARETNQVVVYTPTWGDRTYSKYKGTEVVLSSKDLPVESGKTVNGTVVEVRPDATNTPIPKDGFVVSAGGPAAWFLKENLKPGDSVSIRFDIKGSQDWSQVRQAIGGGPWLVKNGKEFIDYDAEGFGSAFSTARHPRTAIGLTSDNKLIIVTVDGRQKISRGISLPDLAAVMKNLGTIDAINLDGGGSTALSCKGVVLNSPSGGEERPVADALVIFTDQSDAQNLPNLKINGVGQQVQSGEAAQLSVSWGDGSLPLTDEQLQRVVWGTTNGIGFVNQKGYFTPTGLRKGSVKVIYCAQSAECDVKVVAGKPADLKVLVAPDKQNPNNATVTITLADVNDNSIAGEQVKLQVIGGKLDADTGVTDKKGMFVTKVTWDANAVQKIIKATAGGLNSSSDPQPASNTAPAGNS